MSLFKKRPTEKKVNLAQRIVRRLTHQTPLPDRSRWFRVRMAAGLLSLLVSCATRPLLACEDRLALRLAPESLVDDGGADKPGKEIRCTSSRIDLAGNGKLEFTAIAYSNGHQGAFVVSKGSGDSATTIFSSSQVGMLGDLAPELDISDLDGDRVPEMVVWFQGRAGVSSVWVFQSRDERVRSITPVDPNDEEVSLLENAIFVDFDGDGRKDAISRARRAPAIAEPPNDVNPNPLTEYRLYKMLGTSFEAEGRPLLFAGVFVCGKDGARSVQDGFTFDGADMRRSLRVVNGTSGVSARNATFKLNGEVLASPSDFGMKRSHFDSPVHLRVGENTISGEILGPAGCDVAVFIY